MDCLQPAVTRVAPLPFTWINRPRGPSYRGGAAMSAVEICGQDTEFLSGSSVRITPLGVTPAEDQSWGQVKALYR
ncbi:hypothetical protein H8E07_00115 [bacterium]|nr:hypothetical protein [bacterium]